MEEDQRKDMKKGKKKRAIQINYNLQNLHTQEAY